MRLSFWLPIWAGVLASSLSGATITSQVTNLSGNVFRYTYTVSNYSFLMNQELDVQFDPALYSNLTNGVAPAGFNVVLLQPNTPPGVPGDYTALATVNNPSLAGIFSVDFTYLGFGLPGAQPFRINQFSSDGKLLQVLEVGSIGTPEPSAFALGGLGLAGLLALRKRSRWSLGRS